MRQEKNLPPPLLKFLKTIKFSRKQYYNNLALSILYTENFSLPFIVDKVKKD